MSLRPRSIAHRLTVLAAAVAVCVIVAPGAAHARTEAISGSTSSSSWVNYNTVRYVTNQEGNAVAFDPASGTSGMLKFSSSGADLSLRLLNSNGTVLSSSKYWLYNAQTGDYGDFKQTIISGLATNYPFRISACCYHGYGGDTSWNGQLYH